MGIRRVAGDDSTAAKKLARGEPMAPRNARADETVRLSHLDRLSRTPGSDPSQAIADLYATGRTTYGQPNPDARRDARTPEHPAPQPDWSSERATYAIGRNSPVSPAPDESQPQFADDKSANLNDTREGWTRGYGSPHPKFDSGPSGSRYSGRK